MAKRKVCLIESCDNDAEVAGFCRNCYQTVYRWGQRTPGDAVNRMRQLEIYRERMEFRLGGKVKTASKRRGRRRAQGRG